MNIAIIAAAGQGTRMGGTQAKQFREIAGAPIIVHTLRRFEECASIGEIIVVVPSSESAAFLVLTAKHHLSKVRRVVPGGATRTESIWRGLQAVRSTTAEIIAVHDAVRPFVTPDEIDQTMRAAEASGAAILAQPATDTIKEVQDGHVTRTFDRSSLWHAQTPQCFRYDLLRRAYEHALTRNTPATDDSTLVEQLGVTITIVEGSARNIKITRPEDWMLAEILTKQMSDVRC